MTSPQISKAVEIRGKRVRCEACDGHGQRQARNVLEPWPEECSDCGGSGHNWQYPNGAIARYYSGPLTGRRALLNTREANK